jgi:hypothetical protein
MGAWGTGIFSDDLACDIRSDFREHIGDGLTASEARQRLLHDYRSSVNDMDDGPVFWLALATTQWRLGRLEDEVRDLAIAINR